MFFQYVIFVLALCGAPVWAESGTVLSATLSLEVTSALQVGSSRYFESYEINGLGRNKVGELADDLGRVFQVIAADGDNVLTIIY